MNRRLIVAAAALASALVSTAVRAEDNWVLMGSKNVILSKAHDQIDVSEARGRYLAVRVVAKRRGIDINDVEVVYNEGGSHHERRPIHLLPGERTRAIDERPEARFVDKVNLSFAAQPTAIVPAVIEVYGLQNDAGARAVRTSANTSNANTMNDKGPKTGDISAKPTAGSPTTAKPGQAISNSEVLFGAQAVGFAVDRDVIRVGAEVGKFDRIRLRVLDNDIHINSIKVVYATGDAQEIAFDADAKKDTRTKWFDLKGDRFIKEIQLVYRAKPSFRGQAYVEVYGQFAEGWTVDERKKFNNGFELLGAQTAGFTIDRNEVINVGSNEGGFKRLEVRVRDQAITLFEVRVIYGNGEVDIIPANRTKIEAGGRFGPIDLTGGTRVIQKIQPTFRTRIIQQNGIARGRAVVEFWGQH